MNRYNRALEIIYVTEDMKKRLLDETKKKNTTTIQKKIFRNIFNNFKGLTVACCIIILSVVLIYPTLYKSHITPQVESVNPINQTKDIEDLKKNLSFRLKAPTEMPNGYDLDNTSIIAGKLAQITYTKDTNAIVYRIAKGKEDISGDYSSYEYEETINILDKKIVLKGENNLIKLATWTDSEYSYSLNINIGLEKDYVKIIIESISY